MPFVFPTAHLSCVVGGSLGILYSADDWHFEESPFTGLFLENYRFVVSFSSSTVVQYAFKLPNPQPEVTSVERK